MEFNPFTLDEATEIWDDFEDLKDTEFNLGTSTEYLVHDVVIVPFPEHYKEKFIEAYDRTQDGKESISSYSGDEYDVMLVVYDVDNESEYVYMSIRTFAAEKGIRYSFPVHD